MMNKTTFTYSHDHQDDTMIELIKTPNRTEIIVTFDHEDPNVGREIAVYGGDGDEPFDKLADEWAEEVDNFIGGAKDNAFVYDEYSSNMWYAIANSMNWLVENQFGHKSSCGNTAWYKTIEEASRIIAKEFMDKNGARLFDFAVVEESDPRRYVCDDHSPWFGIQQVDTKMNDDNSLLVISDYYGGGCPGMVAIADYEECDEEYIAHRIASCILCTLDSYDGTHETSETIMLERVDGKEN